MFAFIWLIVLAVATADTRIVIIKSDNFVEYQAPIKAFVKEIGRAPRIYSIKGSKRRAMEVAKDLQKRPPPLIFALGAKAAWTARTQLPEIPLVYAQVRNPKRYGIEGSNVAGVSMDPPLDLVLSQFHAFVPNAKKVAFFVSQNTPLVDKAEETIKALGYKPVKIVVSNSQSLRKELSKVQKKADLIWVLPDPIVLKGSNFYHLNDAAHRANLPTLSSSYNLTKAGLFLGISPDYDAIGIHAAKLAKRILDGDKTPFQKEVIPEQIHVTLNRKTQKAIKLEFDEHILDFVDEAISND